MKLIVALWNYGNEYATTRHNAWWIVLDKLLENAEVTPFLEQKKFHATLASGRYKKRICLFAKPLTYMNKSGDAVQKILQFYKIAPEDMLIIHDDIDLPSGTIKLKFNGSHGGQNGIKDIITKIWTARFWRIKIGIWRPDHPEHTPTDRVLGKYTPEELHVLFEKRSEITWRYDDFFRNSGWQ